MATSFEAGAQAVERLDHDDCPALDLIDIDVGRNRLRRFLSLLNLIALLPALVFLVAGFLLVAIPLAALRGVFFVVRFFVAIVRSPRFEKHLSRRERRGEPGHQLPRVRESIQRIPDRFRRFSANRKRQQNLAVQDAAGHANITVTFGYLHTSVDDNLVGRLFEYAPKRRRLSTKISPSWPM